MPLGARILPPPPPPDETLLKELAQIRTTDLSDVMGGSYTMSAEIAPMHRPVERIAGPALTVSVPTNSEFLIKYVLNTARPGDIVVVDAVSNMTSVLAGSNMMRGLLHRGGAAAIFDGIVRDVDEIAEDGLPVFARGIGCAEGPGGPDQGEVDVPIACGGTVVSPGDIIGGPPRGGHRCGARRVRRGGHSSGPQARGQARCSPGVPAQGHPGQHREDRGNPSRSRDRLPRRELAGAPGGL